MKDYNSKNTFKWAFILSVLFHLFIFFKAPFFRINTYHKIRDALEITYSKITQKTEQKPQVTNQKNIPYIEKILEQLPSTSLEKITTNTDLGINTKKKIDKTPISLVDADKKINLIGIKSDVPKSKAYEEYSANVREGIRQRVYGNFDKYTEGAVYVSFVVLKDGRLKDVLIHHDKSTANSYLKDIVAKSIEDAAPFDKFPPELDYPKITYSVTVSFELQ